MPELFETPSHEERFWFLVHRYYDGALTPEETAELNRELAASSSARDAFVQHAVCAELFSEAAATAEAQQVEIAKEPISSSGWHQLREKMRRPIPLSLSVAAVAMTVLIAVLAVAVVPPPGAPVALPSVAQLSRTVQAVWQEDLLDDGSPLDPGSRLQLKAGLAEVKFDSGATVVLRGPADLEILGANAAKLSRGQAVSHVPPLAKGFSLQGPRSNVIDFGTEFGLDASGGASEVHVFEGEVEFVVYDSAGSEISRTRLGAGEASRTAGEKSPRPVALAAMRSHFPPPLPPVQFVGSPVRRRSIVDSHAGVVLIDRTPVAVSGQAKVFKFYSDRDLCWVTPLLFDYDAASGIYTVSGIGRSLKSDGTGLQTGRFVAVAGSDQLEAGRHAFGFYQGSVEIRGGRLRVAESPGVVTYDREGTWLYTLHNPTDFELGEEFSLHPAAGQRLLQTAPARTYAAQMAVQPPLPPSRPPAQTER